VYRWLSVFSAIHFAAAPLSAGRRSASGALHHLACANDNKAPTTQYAAVTNQETAGPPSEDLGVQHPTALRPGPPAPTQSVLEPMPVEAEALGLVALGPSPISLEIVDGAKVVVCVEVLFIGRDRVQKRYFCAS